MPGSFTGIRPTFPATSLTETRSSSRAPAPAQPSGIALRSRSRRLRRRVRDHPPSACGFRSGGHEPRERSTQTERERERRQTSTKGGDELTRATFSTGERSGQRRRRDRGSYRVSERDVELLGLIAEQYAVTLEQLARLICRSYRTARGLRDRWCNAGWTQSAKLAVNLPPLVWLTRRGSKLIESPYRTWEANHGLAAHIEAVTDLRVLLERELQLGTWQCERSLAQTWPSRSASRPHLPDAVLVNDKRIAIEVELTLKSRARLATIVEQLSWDYDSVWYFAPERLRRALFELATSAPYDNVTIHRYPPERADWQRRADLERTWA